MKWVACSLTWVSVAVAVIYAISQTGRMACLWFLVVPALVSWSLTKKTVYNHDLYTDWYAGPKTKAAMKEWLCKEKEYRGKRK